MTGTWLDDFSRNSWEFYHPNWRTHMFQRDLFNHQVWLGTMVTARKPSKRSWNRSCLGRAVLEISRAYICVPKEMEISKWTCQELIIPPLFWSSIWPHLIFNDFHEFPPCDEVWGFSMWTSNSPRYQPKIDHPSAPAISIWPSRLNSTMWKKNSCFTRVTHSDPCPN